MGREGSLGQMAGLVGEGTGGRGEPPTAEDQTQSQQQCPGSRVGLFSPEISEQHLGAAG